MVKQKLQAEAKEIVGIPADSAHDTQNCCGQRHKFGQDVSDDGKEWVAAFPRCCRMTVPRWISRKGKTVSRLPVLRWKCGLFPRSTSRSVHRSLMCHHSAQPSINQVTKCAEFPQTQYIDKFVEMLVVMQRKVPQIQTVLKTVEIPPAKIVDRVVDAPRP